MKCSVKWDTWFYILFIILDSQHPTVKSARFLKPDNHNITIINLEESDVMVLQCNASNIFGYVYADFYLNVRGKLNQKNESNKFVLAESSIVLQKQVSIN